MLDKVTLRIWWWSRHIANTLRRLHADEEGAEFVEYVVVVGALLVLVAGLVWAFGARVADLWSRAISLLR